MALVITPETKTVSYVALSSLIPQGWEDLLGCLAEDAPFSWGDNEITLVSSKRFLEHFREVLKIHEITDAPELQEVIKIIEEDLGDTYVDLES